MSKDLPKQCTSCGGGGCGTPCGYLDNDVVSKEIEKVVQWTIKMGFSTGHADTIDELLEELTWQIEELRGIK